MCPAIQTKFIKMSSVTVIIPAYNAEAFLAEAIESVLRQSFQDWRIVVVDDGSLDNTFVLAKQYARQNGRIQAIRQKHFGVSAARNLGVSQSLVETEYILFLDSDDYLEPDALEVLTQSLNGAPDVSAAYGLPRFVTHDGQHWEKDITQTFGYHRKRIAQNGIKNMEYNANTDFDSLVIWPCIATSGQLLLRREPFLECGGYDESLHLSEDWDFWLRLSLKGSFLCIRRITLNKRNHDSSVSSNGRRMATAESWLRHKIASSYNLSVEQKRIARRGHRYSCVVKLGWAVEDLKRGRLIGFSKTLWRATRSYINYTVVRY